MKYFYKNLFFTGFLLAVNLVQAQTASQYIKKANNHFEHNDYSTAQFYYELAEKQDPQSVELFYKLAECYRNTRYYSKAEKYYEKVKNQNDFRQYPLASFWLASLKKTLAQYNEAIDLYNYFLSRYSQKDYYYNKAKRDVESCTWALQNKQNNTFANVSHLGNEVNTPYSEFAGQLMQNEQIQFSSIRPEKNNDQKQESFASDIYFAEKGDKEGNKADEKEMPFAALRNVSNAFFTADNKECYFTLCVANDENEYICSIYHAVKENEQWKSPELLPQSINQAQSSNSNPNLAEMDGKKTLFFSSNRRGGQGKNDIWYATLNENGTFNSPVNAGALINTADDELTPFFDEQQKKLYFSSTWFNGFGGFDVFSSAWINGSFSEPENLGSPINSSYDDLYLKINPPLQKGLLSSNRNGAQYLEHEACCFDLYAFEIEDRPRPTVPDTNVLLVIHKTDTQKDDAVKEADSLRIAIEKLLPVTVYFHNDEPNPKSTNTTTLLSYQSCYDDYHKLQSEYRTEYSSKFEEDKKQNAIIQIDEWFKNYVDKGVVDLQSFSSQLQQLLQKGKTVSLNIEAYCSPLAKNQYNNNLAKRRISSLQNWIAQYQNGVFKPYLANKKLIIAELPFGEEKADQNISDNRLDLPNSVYDPRAAIERRVAIVSILVE